MRKKLRGRASSARLVRRAKARFASARQAQARTEALAIARALALPVLADMNDQDRDPETRAEAERRRGILPIPGWQPPTGFAEEVAADDAAGATVARQLLAEWDGALVETLLRQVVVKGAEYRLHPDGRVELEPRRVTGPAAAQAALKLAQARDLLRTVDGGAHPFKRRIKQCVNPTCGKWFFDAERGTRKWCCSACGNAHRQLKFAGREKYLSRLKSGAYAQRRCPCSRPDCEG